MTPRSPKTTPRTQSSSRRLRSRADQSLSVQPPELPRVRILRSQRIAATSTSSHRQPVVSPSATTEPHSPPIWNPPQVHDPFPPSACTSSPPELEENTSGHLLISEPLEFAPYRSPHQSFPDLGSLSSSSAIYDPPPGSECDFLPGSLRSLSVSYSAGDFGLSLPTDVEHQQNSSVELQDMSTLGFMMPSQYGPLDHYAPPSALESSNYSTMSQTSYSDAKPVHHPSSSAPYASSYTSSAGLQSHAHRRSGEYAVLPPYQPTSVPRSPYQPSLGAMRGSPAPLNYPPTSSEAAPMLSSAPHNYSYPAIQPHGQTYPPAPVYPPTSYEMGYSHLPSPMYPPSSAAPYSPYDHQSPGSLAPGSSATSPALSPPPHDRSGGGQPPRVLNSRPKPQCWEHGCNGRQFSTFSNLLRHQREKSGTAAKSYCPRCGAEFTRTTARNGHMAHEKCKPRRASDTSR